MIPYEFLHYFMDRGVSCRGSNVGAFGFQDKGFSARLSRQFEQNGWDTITAITAGWSGRRNPTKAS
jgi:hypothetical protein